jgi:hypothetical protein
MVVYGLELRGGKLISAIVRQLFILPGVDGECGTVVAGYNRRSVRIQILVFTTGSKF